MRSIGPEAAGAQLGSTASMRVSVAMQLHWSLTDGAAVWTAAQYTRAFVKQSERRRAAQIWRRASTAHSAGTARSTQTPTLLPLAGRARPPTCSWPATLLQVCASLQAALSS